jgi:hypothetical protein
MGGRRDGRSEVAGSVMHGALRKGENAWLSGFFGGEGAASLAACGRAAGVISVPLAVYPLEQDIEQKVTSKNAKRQKHRERHGDLTRTGENAKPEQGKNRSGKAKKS